MKLALLLMAITTSIFADAPKLTYWYDIPQHIGDGDSVSTTGIKYLVNPSKKNDFSLDFTEKSESFMKLGGWMIELDHIQGRFKLIEESEMVNDTFFGSAKGQATLTYSDGKSEDIEVNCHQSKKTLENKKTVRRVQCFIGGNHSFRFDAHI